MSTAIACSTGGFKGVFLHGVLSALEKAGFRADAYGAASSSVIPAAAASTGRSRDLGSRFWEEGRRLIEEPGVGMSQMALTGIERAKPWIQQELFGPIGPRFLIATSEVDREGAKETQGKGGRRRGRRLLLAAAKGDRSWVQTHLTTRLFDTHAEDARLVLKADNFSEVAYASTRMLHAWDIPATIAGQPFVDAYYTSACPALELAELGFSRVIAVSTEPTLFRNIYQQEIMPNSWQGKPIMIVTPDLDPAVMGVTYTTATEEGLRIIYKEGQKRGELFLLQHGLN